MLRLLGILALGKMICGNRRCNGSFPGGLLLLPALMFGGWTGIAVLAGALSLVGSVLGGVFSGLTSLVSGVFSGSSLLIGIVIGFVLYCYILRQKSETAEEE